MTSPLLERVRSIASDLFGIPQEAISPESSSENIDAWDSTQHLNFILALEESFHLQLSPEETERVRTIGDATKLVEDKIAAASG